MIAAPAVAQDTSVPIQFVLSLSVGQTVTASAGDEVISTRQFRTMDGATLLDSVHTPPKFWANLTIPAGSAVFSTNTRKAFKGCTADLFGQEYALCLIDDDGDGTFDRMAPNDMAGADPIPKVRYSKGRVEVPISPPDMVRKILFQGSGPDGLRFSYREFAHDWARPAFEEQLTIPVTTYPQQFAIKGLVFTAEKVGPMGLTARLDRVDTSKGWPAP